MPGLYSLVATRVTGETITALKYNADHQNHIDNAIPTQHDDYSASVSQMQSQTDGGESGSESQATSMAGELERLRFALAEAKGATYWYQSAISELSAERFGIWD